jgi:hypothetical protein
LTISGETIENILDGTKYNKTLDEIMDTMKKTRIRESKLINNMRIKNKVFEGVEEGRLMHKLIINDKNVDISMNTLINGYEIREASIKIGEINIKMLVSSKSTAEVGVIENIEDKTLIEGVKGKTLFLVKRK